MTVGIFDYGILCALGDSVDACKAALATGQLPALQMRSVATGKEVPVFAVETVPEIPQEFAAYDCRNNRLALGCYTQIEESVSELLNDIGESRLGVVIGSSTSGIDASEAAFVSLSQAGVRPGGYDFDTQHAMGSLSRFVAELSGAKGPAYTVSTACSSAAKAMLCAKQLIDADICDAVITGGVDSLCALTVNGFDALGQLSPERVNPLSENRSGLNIGEGGALFLLTRKNTSLSLCGGGESMDAYHMSAPLPDGTGAALAMERALHDAHVSGAKVSYVNMHGTGTSANDSMEAQAILKVVPHAHCSSSKPLFGHCLGAAGALEAAVCCMALQDDKGRLPVHHFDGAYDEKIPLLKIATENTTLAEEQNGGYILSNSFAFGGNNCSLVLARNVSENAGGING